MLNFLDVESKKQSGINKLFFCIVALWIGGGFVVNMINQLTYRENLKQWRDSTQQSSFFQMEWIRSIPDVPAPIFYLSIIAIVFLFKYIMTLHKEQKELTQAFLPILAEMKTMLSYLIK